ncbi:hypothetical protein [Candidatus Nitronereus thalassa]|uniref:Uncharacterized protein n=1 Tax=Candidatus Nitronereus thalassa TaxID=3020898 RepID=A0ABU3K2X0_9BACT|nr:hypothetical protein [Candidatus Nitronereus thalassa]MDT7040732.1 hypothetical protein [Candidatus Nitronereus thalassa]
MSCRIRIQIWLTGMLFLLTLTLTACGDSAPPPQASLIDRALVDTSLREQLIERGAADEEFVHQILEKFSLSPGGDEKLSEILAAHFEHHPETGKAVLRRLKTQKNFQKWLIEELKGG